MISKPRIVGKFIDKAWTVRSAYLLHSELLHLVLLRRDVNRYRLYTDWPASCAMNVTLQALVSVRVVNSFCPRQVDWSDIAIYNR
jgi:hypothetical protein